MQHDDRIHSTARFGAFCHWRLSKISVASCCPAEPSPQAMAISKPLERPPDKNFSAHPRSHRGEVRIDASLTSVDAAALRRAADALLRHACCYSHGAVRTHIPSSAQYLRGELADCESTKEGSPKEVVTATVKSPPHKGVPWLVTISSCFTMKFTWSGPTSLILRSAILRGVDTPRSTPILGVS